MQLIGLLIDILNRQRALYELLEKSPVRESLELLKFLLVFTDVVQLLGFFSDLLLDAFQCLDHVGTCDRL